MKFRTEIQIPHSPDQIDYQKKILSVGSCFAESMGKRLEEMKFQTLVNPLGIFYNPLSIGKILQKAIDRQVYFESEYADHLGEWFSFDLHGKFREAEKGRFEEKTTE
ncbi:MAG: GSCFA domain-containing protein, partial [Bacteroidetes bacterium]|nr:GSCFA domain-containing protein [Bacteroidota bacterium]